MARIDPDDVARAKAALKSIEGGGSPHHVIGEAGGPVPRGIVNDGLSGFGHEGGPGTGLGRALGQSLRDPRQSQPPPESCTFVEVPPTEENPTGKVMVRNVVMVGIEPTLVNNLVNAIAQATADAIYAKLIPRIVELSDKVETVHSRVVRVQKRIGEEPAPAAKPAVAKARARR